MQSCAGRRPFVRVTLDFAAADEHLCPAFAFRLVRGVTNGAFAGVDAAAPRRDRPATLDLLTPRTQLAPRANPQSLADLFKTVVSESSLHEAPSAQFARGLCDLVGAREVLVREAPIVPDFDCESIYFRVNGDDRSGMILQLLFERNRSVTTSEFRLMKAATGLTAALLEFERVSIDETALATREQLAQVA